MSISIVDLALKSYIFGQDHQKFYLDHYSLKFYQSSVHVFDTYLVLSRLVRLNRCPKNEIE